jgi:copper(I)-binding protein
MNNTAQGNGLRLLLIIIFLGATVFIGCKGEPPRLSIENARVAFSEAMIDEASAYLTIKNAGGRDTLIGAKTSIPGASADIHEMRGDLMVISKALPIPAKSSIELMPVGSHIMITHLPVDVKAGYRFSLTLVFEKSGEMQVPLEFTKPRPQPMKQPMMHEHRM